MRKTCEESNSGLLAVVVVYPRSDSTHENLYLEYAYTIVNYQPRPPTNHWTAWVVFVVPGNVAFIRSSLGISQSALDKIFFYYNFEFFFLRGNLGYIFSM